MRKDARLLEILTLLWLCVAAHAQVQNVGIVRGIVKDPSGAAIVGASVTIKNQATGVQTSTLTNDAGAYTIANLPIGVYDLEVTFQGFQTGRRTDLRLISGLVLTYDISLPLGETTQVVAVVASQQIIETASSSTGNTSTLQEFKDLPMQMGGNPRSSLAFISTLPGFNDSGSLGRSTFMGAGGSNGFASSVVGYTIDGVSAATIMAPALEDPGPLVPELVEEFRFATNLNAETGGHLGSSMGLVMKSGTNNFHGTAWEYWRDQLLDARQWQAAQRSQNIQNEYGFVLGGPILKNKMFFLGSWDGYKYRQQPGVSTGTVPTAQMRAGNFSEWLGPQAGTDALGRPVLQGAIYDPTTVRTVNGVFVRDMFAGNIIPPSRLSPLSAKLATRVFPTPTRAGTQLNWVGTSYRGLKDAEKFALKIDNNFWHSHRLSFGFDIQPIWRQGTQPFFPVTGDSSESDYTQRQYRARLTETWTVRPNMLVSFRAAFNRYRFINDLTERAGRIGCDAGFTGTFTCASPFTHVETQSDFGYFWPRFYRFFNELPVDVDLSLHKGRHDLKFGLQFQQQVTNIINGDRTPGEFTFNSRETGQPGFPTTGVGYASYLLGDVDSGVLQNFLANKYTGRYFALYAQDQWRVTPKLTISLGLRWDYTQPISETSDRIGSFDRAAPNAAAGGRPGALTFWGEGPGRNGRRYLVNPYYKALGPRVGLAYTVTPKTVIRASYGIFYASLLSDFIGGENIVAYGWTARVTRNSLDAGVTPAFNWNNGFPNIFPKLPSLDPTALNGSGLQVYDPTDNKPATAQNLGFSAERELPGNLLVKGEYVGKFIHGLTSFGYYSPPANELDTKYLSLGNLLGTQITSPAAQAAGIALPYPGFTGTVAQSLRPYPQYTGISSQASRSHYSLYNAFMLTVQKRFGQDLFFTVGYTFSKQFERASSLQHYTLANAGKTLMTYDRPQTLTISYNYELPFGPGKRFLTSNNPIAREFVRGWKFGGIFQYSSGVPVLVTTRGVITGLGAQWALRNNDVPIRTSSGCSDFDSAYSGAPYRYLAPGAFRTPPAFTFGDTRILPATRDCASLNENIMISKDFTPIRDFIKIRLGAAAFNVFNRHRWTGLQADIDNPTQFGRFTSASGPRTGQLWLKLEF